MLIVINVFIKFFRVEFFFISMPNCKEAMVRPRRIQSRHFNFDCGERDFHRNRQLLFGPVRSIEAEFAIFLFIRFYTKIHS